MQISDDYWNVDSWKGITKFYSVQKKKKNLPKGCVWSGRRLAKIQANTRPDHVWPEVWTKIGKAAQNREKQEWAKEKPELDNARRLRGIYSMDRKVVNFMNMFFEESRTGLNHWTRWRMTVTPETHHAEPRVELQVPSEGSFPTPHEADEYDIGCVAGKPF